MRGSAALLVTAQVKDLVQSLQRILHGLTGAAAVMGRICIAAAEIVCVFRDRPVAFVRPHRIVAAHRSIQAPNESEERECVVRVETSGR